MADLMEIFLKSVSWVIQHTKFQSTTPHGFKTFILQPVPISSGPHGCIVEHMIWTIEARWQTGSFLHTVHLLFIWNCPYHWYNPFFLQMPETSAVFCAEVPGKRHGVTCEIPFKNGLNAFPQFPPFCPSRNMNPSKQLLAWQPKNLGAPMYALHPISAKNSCPAPPCNHLLQFQWATTTSWKGRTVYGEILSWEISSEPWKHRWKFW